MQIFRAASFWRPFLIAAFFLTRLVSREGFAWTLHSGKTQEHPATKPVPCAVITYRLASEAFDQFQPFAHERAGLRFVRSNPERGWSFFASMERDLFSHYTSLILEADKVERRRLWLERYLEFRREGPALFTQMLKAHPAYMGALVRLASSDRFIMAGTMNLKLLREDFRDRSFQVLYDPSLLNAKSGSEASLAPGALSSLVDQLTEGSFSTALLPSSSLKSLIFLEDTPSPFLEAHPLSIPGVFKTDVWSDQKKQASIASAESLLNFFRFKPGVESKNIYKTKERRRKWDRRKWMAYDLVYSLFADQEFSKGEYHERPRTIFLTSNRELTNTLLANQGSLPDGRVQITVDRWSGFWGSKSYKIPILRIDADFGLLASERVSTESHAQILVVNPFFPDFDTLIFDLA